MMPPGLIPADVNPGVALIATAVIVGLPALDGLLRGGQSMIRKSV